MLGRPQEGTFDACGAVPFIFGRPQGGARGAQGARFSGLGRPRGSFGHPGAAKELQKQPGVGLLVAFGCLLGSFWRPLGVHFLNILRLISDVGFGTKFYNF